MIDLPMARVLFMYDLLVRGIFEFVIPFLHLCFHISGNGHS